MRLSLTLLGLISPAFAVQYPLQSEPPIHAQSITLVDALGADGNYTRLIRLLQRTRLIPTLNRLNGSTLFAPTNDALEKEELWSRASEVDEGMFHAFADNIQEQLRQQLFYHILNYSIAELPKEGVEVHKTLHYPRKPIEPPTRQPPPNPPWMPIPGGTLDGEPQRLRLAGKEEEDKAWLGTDFAGNGGVEIVRPIVETDNGQLIGIDGMLVPPADLSQVILEHPSLSYFRKILSDATIKDLANASAVTLFLPQDTAWDKLDEVERLYLESGFSEDDVRKIIDLHAVVKKGVHWSNTWKNDTKLTTVEGNELIIQLDSDATKVSGKKLIQPDIYASNGVVHVVEDLLLPPGSLQLTPEKYLLALNCTNFVSLLRSVSLSPLVNNTNSSYTILAPRDDVITLIGDDKLPERGSAELARLLKYHFLPGRWTPKMLSDGMLLQTALEESGLRGGRQVLDIGVTEKGDSRELTFGGAGVIGGEPLKINNNTTIYLITRPLTPPQDALAAALPSLQFSTFLAAVFSSSLANKLKTAPSTTLLIPRNNAFEQLGLVTTHLLLSSSKSDLEEVIQHHVLTEVAYASDIFNGTRKTYPTLEGSDLQVERQKNGSIFFEPSGGWEGLRGEIGPGRENILTRTGVIHEVSGVMLPRTLDITIEKLANAAKGSTMATLAIKAGMGWVLNGTEPPAGSEWADAGIKGTGWTLLCPTDASFKGVNMTLLWEDVPAMRKLVEQHLIPAPSAGAIAKSDELNRPIMFDGGATYSTLLSRNSFYGDVVFRPKDEKDAGKGYVVGIKDARGTNGLNDWANVIAWGRSTQGSTGGVVQIDRLLIPYQPPWWVEYGSPVLLGIVGVAFIGAFFYGVRWFWKRNTEEATYEPVGGFDREDSDG